MTNAEYISLLEPITERLLHGGIFFTTKCGDVTNTMTIGWGGPTFYWGAPMFAAPIRPSRHSHALAWQSGEFTLSIPKPGEFAEALKLCGTKSGRDIDKFATAGLSLQPGREVSTPVITGCALHLECRVVMRQSIDPVSLITPERLAKNYPSGDLHTLFYGQIVAHYEG